jgi:hypothetical protein
MESFWGSVELMVFIYALAAVVSYLVAWIIKLLYSAIEKNKARAEARAAAAAGAAPEGTD